MSRGMAAALLWLLLGGCTSQPKQYPAAIIVPPPILCSVPAGLTIIDREPDRPVGDYTQRDVSKYVIQLHQWGASGWERVNAINEWSDKCVQRK